MVSNQSLRARFACSLVLLTSTFSLAGQNNLESGTDSQAVDGTYVVTGTRTKKAVLDSPVRVEVVSRDTILRSNARDLRDAIAMVPGVLLRDIHGKSGQEVWMQGLDGKHVLVLIDGDPVSQSTNQTTDLSQIGIMNIEQIEIVKGAVSALYGSGAMGGVINVITRKPTRPLVYTVKGDIGTYGRDNIGADRYKVADANSAGVVSIREGLWDAQLSYDWRDSDGFDQDAYDRSDTNWERDGADSQRLNMNAMLGFSPDASSRYALATDVYSEEIRSRYYSTGPSPLPYLKTEKVDRVAYKGSGDWLMKDWGDLKVRYFYEDFDNPTSQDIANNPGLEQHRDASQTVQKFSTQWNLPINDWATRTIGVEYDQNEIAQKQWKRDDLGDKEYSSELTPGADSSRRVFYVQDDLFLGENLELLPGFRWQDDSDFGNYLAPRVNGRVDLAREGGYQQFIRFGIGRGYRVPSLKERFYVFDHSQHGYMVLGNANLKPESSDSIQLGWSIQESGNYLVDLNLFYNDLEDFIETEFSGINADNVQIFEYDNIEEARSRGVEMVSQIHYDNGLSWMTGYTYTDAIDRKTNNALPKQPKHQVKSSLQYDSADDNFSLTFNARWESHSYFDATNFEKSPAHSLFDLKADFGLAPGFNFYTGIDNLRNTQKDPDNPHDLRPLSGRYIYVGLRWSNE